MDKEHTFQVGDRVVCWSGEFKGVIVGEQDEFWGIERDDFGFWWTFKNRTEHDRDFKVGDWVRYEGVNDLAFPGREGKIGQITDMLKNSAKVHWKDGLIGNNGYCYLVKIQNQQKESQEMLPKFKHGDHVELKEKGYEITSSSLKEGDKGVVKDHKYASDGWQPKYKYRVVFQTKNGPRSQWVWENHLAHSAEDPMLKKLEEKVKELGEKSDKLYAEWSDVVSILAEARDQLEKYKDLLKWVGGK